MGSGWCWRKLRRQGMTKPKRKYNRLASLTGVDWLRVGFSLWTEPPYNFRRDFLVMEPANTLHAPRKRFLAVEKLSSYIRFLLAQLRIPRRTRGGWELVLPYGLEAHFSGHSPRNFMTSVAAVLGYNKIRGPILAAGPWACQPRKNTCVLQGKWCLQFSVQ